MMQNNRQLTFGDKTLAYDDNGNLQSITDSNGTTLYSWNARNQLVGISGPSVNASFVYDGVGRREKKTINGSLTEFLYDDVNPVQETSGASILANILPGLGIDEFLTRTDIVAGIIGNFLTESLGSPVAVTDNAGAVQSEYTYEAFGKTTVTGSINNNSYQYTGRENDGSGLYFYRARYYHPALQRFIGEDPIGFAGGDSNLYAYVQNSPLKFRDPLGLVVTCHPAGSRTDWESFGEKNGDLTDLTALEQRVSLVRSFAIGRRSSRVSTLPLSTKFALIVVKKLTGGEKLVVATTVRKGVRH